MDGSKIRENIENIKNIIAKESENGNATLVAATKTRSPEEIQLARAAGLTDAGENRVQEFCEKMPLNAYEGLTKHFIGHLQSNKVNKIVGNVELIQSVDSVKLLNEINSRAALLGIRQDILAEINIGGEDAKSGMAPETLESFLESASVCSNIRVMGLMTVAPKAENDDVCQYFTKMYNLFIDNRRYNCDNIIMDYLSMGMSGDFRQALACGSNMIRIGTAVFGPRM